MATFEIIPSKTVMLVIDMTKTYFDQRARLFLPAALEILPRLNKLLAVCRQKGVHVIYSRPAYQRDGSNKGLLTLFSPTRKGGLTKEEILADEEGFTIYPDISPVGDEPVVGKPRFSAFFATELDLILRGKGVDTIIIGGVTTNTCCQATVRDAYYLNYKVIFLSDGNGARPIPDLGWGSYTAEQVQRFMLATLANGWCQVSSVDEVITELMAEKLTFESQ